MLLIYDKGIVLSIPIIFISNIVQPICQYKNLK